MESMKRIGDNDNGLCVKSSPGEGWEFCTNTEDADLTMLWARKEYAKYGNFQFRIVDEAYDKNGQRLSSKYKSVWRKRK